MIANSQWGTQPDIHDSPGLQNAINEAEEETAIYNR